MQAQDSVEEMRQAFNKRLDIIHEKLNNIPGFSCLKPQGAFYLFPNVQKAVELTGFKSVDEFSTALLEEALVAVVPGSGFGADSYIRLSYATSLEKLEAAVTRMEQFVEKNSR